MKSPATALFATLLFAALLGLAAPPARAAGDARPPRQPLLIPGKHTLFQRVIVRPDAQVFAQPAATGGQPVPGFTVFYVYDRKTVGTDAWVQVGRSADGHILGWMHAAKLIDWPHALIGTFTNPAGRERVMFFANRQDLQNVLQSDNPATAEQPLRTAALAGNPGPVIALEPANFVDVTQHFYLLPVISAHTVEMGSGGTTRLIEVISAPDTPHNPAPPPHDPLKDFRAGVVFLLDTTESTQPYIDSTRKALASIVQMIGASAMKANFRFGAMGYRDSLADTPKLEYVTRIFATPDFSKPADAVLPALARIKATTVSSIGFDEDPIAGIKAAIDGIDWSHIAARFIVLVTDAGARTPDNPHSVTHLGINEIRALAREKQIALYVIHLKTPAARAAHDIAHAEQQYVELTQDAQTGDPLYYDVPGGNTAILQQRVTALANALLHSVATQAGRSVPTPAPRTPLEQHMAHQADVVATAMRLAYLGRIEQTQAPDVVHSFTVDSDIRNPGIPAIQIRVLLTRNQLSDLANALRTIVQEGLAHRIDEQVLFSRLRIALATAARGDPQRIAHATRFGDLLGEYLDGLPYRSSLLNITEDDWVAMGGIAQRETLAGIEAKLRLFEAYAQERDLWVDINGSHDPGEAVFPVPLELAAMTVGTPAVLDAAGVRRRLGQGGDVFEVVIEALSLPPASRIAVVGPSGCGKSTALALLALALRPDGARRFVLTPPAGAPIDALALWRDGRHDRLAGARARMLGFVPQVGGLLPFLSLRDNIALPQSMLGRTDNARVAALAERLEIAAVLDRLPAQVSVGQRQRAAVARALAHEPALVLADEPTASVHPAQADVVMGLLAAFAQRTGAALIVATHDRHLADAAGLAAAPMRPAADGRRSVLAWAA